MTSESIAIQLHEGEAARDLAGIVSGLYRLIFSLPPFLGNEAEFINQQSYYREMTGRSGFKLATAKDQERHVGFAYGFLLPASTAWWEGLPAGLPEEFTEETGFRTFVIIDFGVLPDMRGKGIGRALHDTLLSSSGAQRASLTVQRKAADTQAIYQHWGWRRVGQKAGSLGGSPVTFDVYVLDINC